MASKKKMSKEYKATLLDETIEQCSRLEMAFRLLGLAGASGEIQSIRSTLYAFREDVGF